MFAFVRTKLLDSRFLAAKTTFTSWEADANGIGLHIRELAEIDLPLLSRAMSSTLLLDMLAQLGAAVGGIAAAFSLLHAGHPTPLPFCLAVGCIWVNTAIMDI
jgi:ABC-type transport system involved in cytochrome bd biosynthesis fused ATPase/permease subunit